MGVQGNRVYVRTATAGTGTITLGAVVSPAFTTFAEAGIANGDIVRSYCIEEGTNFEIGTGTYTSAGTTLSRTTVFLSKIAGVAGTTKMTLAGSATVRVIAAEEDLVTTTADNTCSGSLTLTGIAASNFSAALNLTGANAGIELGQQGTANTPLIDFHAGATNVDYDCRIIALTGTGVTAQGYLQLEAATTNFAALTPSTTTTTGAVTVGGGVGVAGDINWTGVAWTAFTPTVTANTGTFTSVSGAGRYQQHGKVVHFDITITVTTVGTAGSAVRCTFPVTASTAGTATAIFAGRETALTGNMCQGFLSTSTTFLIQKYDSSFIGTDGQVISMSGTYEAA